MNQIIDTGRRAKEIIYKMRGAVPLLLAIGVVLGVMTGTAAAQEGTPAARVPNSLQSARQLRPGDSRYPSTIKLGTALVSLRITVTDRTGRAIGGLKKEDFKIYENRVEQEASFFSDEDTPASVAILVDTSASMSGDKILRAKEALARFIQTSHPRDEYFLIGFSSTPRLLLDGSHDGQAVLNQFNNVSPAGNTAVYDAVYLGIEKLSHASYPKRAIIVISDGEDNQSRHTLVELRRSLQESDIVVYTIGIADRRAVPIRFVTLGELVMGKIAEVSGGKSCWPRNPEQTNEAFEQIALELRQQYSVGYYLASDVAADGKWHRVKVVMAAPQQPKLVVRSREGYYAFKPLRDETTGAEPQDSPDHD
jgi:Ca-activated chloride channel homolog